MQINDSRVIAMPYSGSPQTIALMCKAALESQRHFAVRKYAESICSQLDSKDYISEYLAMYHAVLRDTRYMRDPLTIELVKAPYRVAEQILAGGRPSLDCDDSATFLAALCLAVGGKVEFATVAFEKMPQQQYSHVFTRVQDQRTGRWIVLDPVAAERTPTMLRDIKAMKVWAV